jgi:hypothetical protein
MRRNFSCWTATARLSYGLEAVPSRAARPSRTGSASSEDALAAGARLSRGLLGVLGHAWLAQLLLLG